MHRLESLSEILPVQPYHPPRLLSLTTQHRVSLCLYCAVYSTLHQFISACLWFRSAVSSFLYDSSSLCLALSMASLTLHALCTGAFFSSRVSRTRVPYGKNRVFRITYSTNTLTKSENFLLSAFQICFQI